MVEAGLRSGTTSTANFVNEMNRPLFAVPGAITSPMSAGCHQLINDGKAILASDWSEVAAMLGDQQMTLFSQKPESRPIDSLSFAHQQVLDAFPLRKGKSAEELMVATGLSLREVLSALSFLEVGGFVHQDAQVWRLVRA